MSANVQRLSVNNVYSDIMTVLNDYPDRTRTEYQRSLTEFFMFFWGKDFNTATKEEIEHVPVGSVMEKITLKHATQYRGHLKKKHVEGHSTVNKKMAALKTIYKGLQGYGYEVNHVAFAVKPLKVNFKSYGVLNIEQVKVMAELALEEKFHPLEKSLYILLAAITSVRVDALLAVAWTDIRMNNKTGYYNVKAVDKGDEPSISPIEVDFYNRLCALKTETTTRTDKVFMNLTADSINDCVKRLAKKMGIPEELRITTHSLRKTAPVYELENTGSLERAAKQTGHKSIQVLADHYTDKTVDQGSLAGIRMLKPVHEEVFELVSKEEILAMLKETNLTVYNQLAVKIQDMIDL